MNDEGARHRLPRHRLSRRSDGSTEDGETLRTGASRRVRLAAGMNLQRNVVESAHQTIAPALQKQPGARQQEVRPDAPETLLSAENLVLAARVQRAQRDLVKDKAYRATPIGGEV